jgi:hypothetical protein
MIVTDIPLGDTGHDHARLRRGIWPGVLPPRRYAGSNLPGNHKEIVKPAFFTAYGKVGTSPPQWPSPGTAIDGTRSPGRPGVHRTSDIGGDLFC